MNKKAEQERIGAKPETFEKTTETNISGKDRNETNAGENSTKSFFSDLSALPLNGAGSTAGAVEVLTHVPVRKPNRHEFFRVHPELVLATTVFTDKEEGEFYIVAPSMRGVLVGEARPTPGSDNQPPRRSICVACVPAWRRRSAQPLGRDSERSDGDR